MPEQVRRRSRPLVAVPGRFSSAASALRYQAVVVARALAEAVYDAGGEPVMVHPRDGDGIDAGARLGWADALLLPGGGDLDPAVYGQEVEHDAVYDVDATQDAFDLAAGRWALGAGVPLLAVCRGLQVVNVALGGTLNQHVEPPHRHLRHDVTVIAGSGLADALGTVRINASCYHHQTVDRLGDGLVAVAHAGDGTVEGVEMPGRASWFLGVQWHPEDTASSDPAQQRLLRTFVEATRG